MKNYNNDKVEGLKTEAKVTDGKIVKSVKYVGKNGKGYDGCGTHTHK